MKQTALIIFLIALGINAVSHAQNIIVFRDANWSGPSIEIGGDWDAYGNPDWNDQISSIRIPPGARIEVFTDSQYQGNSKVLTGDWTTNEEFNDVISSIRFLHRNNQPMGNRQNERQMNERTMNERQRNDRPMNERRESMPAVPAVSNRLCCGQELPLGGELHSLNDRYMLAFQRDRNLVVYKRVPSNSPLWATATNNRVNRCVMQADGNLVLYNDANPIWSSNTYGNQNAYLVMQDDGNLVVYTTDGRALWASNTMQADEPAQAAPVYQQQPQVYQQAPPAYQQAPQPAAYQQPVSSGPCELARPSYENAVHAVENEAFKEGKMQMARQAIRDKCLSLGQIRGIANLFAFEEQRLEFLKYAYDFTDNKGDYYTLADVFAFDSNKRDLTGFLATK